MLAFTISIRVVKAALTVPRRFGKRGAAEGAHYDHGEDGAGHKVLERRYARYGSDNLANLNVKLLLPEPMTTSLSTRAWSGHRRFKGGEGGDCGEKNEKYGRINQSSDGGDV